MHWCLLTARYLVALVSSLLLTHSWMLVRALCVVTGLHRPSCCPLRNVCLPCPPGSLDDLVQYVVVRADLAAPPHEWPAGALMAQAVHAALAAAVAYASHPATAAYTAQPGGAYRPGALTAAAATAAGQPADAPQMHTVVLSAKSETVLENLAAKLAAVPLDFVLWREQPEGVATALATRVRWGRLGCVDGTSGCGGRRRGCTRWGSRRRRRENDRGCCLLPCLDCVSDGPERHL